LLLVAPLNVSENPAKAFVGSHDFQSRERVVVTLVIETIETIY
jgi:hypothetical protein